MDKIIIISALPDGRERLEGLSKHPEIFEKPELFEKYLGMLEALEGQVGNNFESLVIPYLLKRGEQMASKSGGPFINLSRMLKDPEAAKWNVLPMREGDISDADWKQLREDLGAAIKKHFPGDEHLQKLNDALAWFDKMTGTRDAQAGLQVVRKRVASIVDFLGKQDVKPELLGSEALVDRGIEIAQELVKILADGGTACPDRAVVALEDAEMYAKAFSKKEGSAIGYAVNVVVNEFKRNIILAKFVDPSQRESIETYLYFMILLNEALGLEYATESMLYEGIAIKIPFDEAIKKAYEAFNEEDLIGFVQDHPLMQAQFKGDAKALGEFKKLINDPKEGLGYSGFGATGPVRAEEINNIELIDSFDGSDHSGEYLKRLKSLIGQAPSAEALDALRERFQADYAILSIEDINKLDKANAAELSAIMVQIDKMIDNFKVEKTKLLLKDAGFLSDKVDYELPESSYWLQ